MNCVYIEIKNSGCQNQSGRGYAAERRCLVHVLKDSTKLPHEYNYKISEEI